MPAVERWRETSAYNLKRGRLPDRLVYVIAQAHAQRRKKQIISTCRTEPLTERGDQTGSVEIEEARFQTNLEQELHDCVGSQELKSHQSSIITK